ncbi:MAG: hypothetical protein AAGG48_27850 [Planctomycetota bacterium]
MRILKRIAALVAIILGFLGAIACLALIVGSLVAGTRLRDATSSTYADVDGLFTQAKSRVRQVQEIADDAMVTTSDVRDSLSDWSKRTTRERLREELDERFALERRTRDLSDALTKADSFAEMSADSITLAIKVTEIANRAGANVDSEGLELLLQQITRLRGSLSDAVDDVNNVSNELNMSGDSEDLRDRLEATVELVGRVLVTLKSVQSGIVTFEVNLENAQRRVAETESQLIDWIQWVTLVLVLLFAWSFAGQFALARVGWTTVREHQ